jgi:putative ABC transport system permease protein
VSPLLALRALADERSFSTRRDFVIWAIYLVIAGALTAFAIWQAETWTDGLSVAGGLGLAIAILVGVARLLIFLVRKLLPGGWSFVVRQGVANLSRPNNRTLLLTLSLGMGTFLLLTIYLTRDVLLRQFRSLDANEQPNIFLFDIQSDQKLAVAELVRQEKLPVIQEAPIVTMRLVEVKGRKASDLLKDPQRKFTGTGNRARSWPNDRRRDGLRCPGRSDQSQSCEPAGSGLETVPNQFLCRFPYGRARDGADFQRPRQPGADAGGLRAPAKCSRGEISQRFRA